MDRFANPRAFFLLDKWFSIINIGLLGKIA